VAKREDGLGQRGRVPQLHTRAAAKKRAPRFAKVCAQNLRDLFHSLLSCSPLCHRIAGGLAACPEVSLEPVKGPAEGMLAQFSISPLNAPGALRLFLIALSSRRYHSKLWTTMMPFSRASLNMPGRAW